MISKIQLANYSAFNKGTKGGCKTPTMSGIFLNTQHRGTIPAVFYQLFPIH